MRNIIVLHKDGVWYAKNPESYHQWRAGMIRCNGNPVHLCPDIDWLRTNEKPTIIETLEDQPHRLVGFKRRAEFESLNIPIESSVGVEVFDLVHGEPKGNAEFFPFYEAIYEPQDPIWKRVQGEIIIASLDAKPVKFAFPVRVAPPQCFSEWREVHHLYPCSIDSDNLFDFIYPTIQGIVDGNENLKMDNFQSIKTLTVKFRLQLSKPKTVNRDISSFGSRKPKYKEFKVSEEWNELLALRGSSYGNGHGEFTPTISAENYADLEAKVYAYVEEIKSRLDIGKLQQCPHCFGKGFINTRGKNDQP